MLKQLTTATLLTTLLLTPTTKTNAEIIVGIDDPNNPGTTINTDITSFTGNPVDINNTSTTIHIGHSGTANLLINNASILNTGNTFIGFDPSANGIVNIQDPTSNWTINSNLFIGKNGHATLNISNGATVTTNNYAHIGHSSGSNGIVNIQDQGSSWTIVNSLSVGTNSQATLNITNGATVITNNYTYISSNSTINIQSQGSSLTTNNTLYIGLNEAQGTLNISNGATVNATNTSIGENGHITLNNGTLNTNFISSLDPQHLTGTGTINLNKKIFDKIITLQNQSDLISTITLRGTNQNITLNTDLSNNNNELGAGNIGTGILNIQNGIQLNSQYGYIGKKLGSNGTVNIQDTGSSWTISKNLYVGAGGKAILNITNGATVTSNQNVSINDYYGEQNNNSQINIDGQGSTLSTQSITINGPNGQSYLNIENSATVNTNSLHIGLIDSDYLGATATLNLQGENSKLLIANDLTIEYNYEASINISDQAQITINENLMIHNSDTTNINLSLTTTTDPFIDILGNAQITGKLNILTDNLTALEIGDTFILLDIEGIRTGSFTNLAENNIAAYYNGLALRLTYQGGDGNDIELFTTHAPDFGDTNDDGQIDQLDLDNVKNNLGTNNIQGDANHDGTVNLQDLFAVRNNFHANQNTSTTIPEPTTLLTILTLAPLTLRRRKQR